MIPKTRNVSIGCTIFKNSVRTLISANNFSKNTHRKIDQSGKKTFKLCFLTMCFDVNCSCNDANKDTCTSMSTTTDENTTLRTGDTSLHCMIFNRRIIEAKNEVEKRTTTQYTQTENVKDNNNSFTNQAFTKKRGMLCRFHILNLHYI